MKYALYTHFDRILMEEGTDAVCRYAAEHGFSGVEHLEDISDEGRMSVPTKEDAKALRKALDEYGLSCCCLSVGSNVWTDANAAEKLKRQAEIASILGSPFLHHTNLTWLKTAQDTPSFKEGFERALAVSTEVTKYAATLGVKTLYEEQGVFLNGLERFGRFLYEIRRVCPDVGVCGDMGNIRFVDESPEAFFKRFKRDIRHVHVKAYLEHDNMEEERPLCYHLNSGRWLEEVSPTLCPETMKSLMAELKDVGYDGYYAFEMSAWDNFEAVCKETMALLDTMQ